MNSMKIFRLISISIVLTIMLASTWSCGDKKAHDSIPEVAVNVYIDVNSTMYIELNTIGGWVYLTGGYKGLLVYRISVDEFVAYDRACPYDPFDPAARIVMDPSGLTCSDSNCTSQFGILDGSIIKGPATIPLKRYNTYYDGSILSISN